MSVETIDLSDAPEDIHWPENIQGTTEPKHRDIDKKYKILQKLLANCHTHTKGHISVLLQLYCKLNLENINYLCFDSHRLYYWRLYCASPRVYRLLQRALTLPPLSSLFSDMCMSADKLVLEMLKIKVSYMSPAEVQCMAFIDSIPLTPYLSYREKEDKIFGLCEANGVQEKVVANKAAVIIICGLFTKWQVLAGYVLLRDDDDESTHLMQYINTLFGELNEAGLNIRTVTFTPDHKGDIPISSKELFLRLNGRQVYLYHDTQRLLHSLQNEMKECDIQWDDTHRAQYQHIKSFYEKDKNVSFKLAPNLTDTHFDSDDTSCAAEVFSRDVAAGMSAYIHCEHISKEAQSTVTLIQKLNDLIDLLNFGICHEAEDGRFNKHAHMEAMGGLNIFVNKLRFVHSDTKRDVTHESKFLKCLKDNINSYLFLLEDLNCDGFTRRPNLLNRGATAKFLDTIRQRCATDKITAEEFSIACQKSFTLQLIKTSIRQRRVASHKRFLKACSEIITETTKYTSPSDLSSTCDEIPLSDYDHINSADRNTLLYVSAFILKKCKEYHKCDEFQKYVEGKCQNITINHLSRYLAYSQRRQICFGTVPCNHFTVIIEDIEKLFQSVFRENGMLIKTKILQEMWTRMNISSTAVPPCVCFPWKYFLRLFLKIRMHYTLTFNNQAIAEGEKYFILPLLLPDIFKCKVVDSQISD